MTAVTQPPLPSMDDIPRPSKSDRFLKLLDRWWRVFEFIFAGFALVISLLAAEYARHQTKLVNTQTELQLKTFESQLKQIEEDAQEKERAFEAERLQFQHAQTARFVDDANKINGFLAHHPGIAGYFERTLADDPSESLIARNKRLKAEFLKESLTTKVQISLACEMLGDFMDASLLQQESLNSDDWNRWWNYFMDAYDENPMLREFFGLRSDWYKSREILENREVRPLQYRGKENRRRLDHPSFLPLEDDAASD